MTTVEKNVKYKITFGPKKEADREIQFVSDKTAAIKLFETKDKAGLHVNVYQIETVITETKIA